MARERRVDHRSDSTPGKGIPYVEDIDQVYLFPEHSKALADRVDELFETNAGPKGDSAYQVWLDEGNTGSEQDYLDSLKGEKGDSAYKVWLDAGNSGTEAEYLDSLKGADGDPGENGDDGDPGVDGKSAYEIAQDDGFVGDEAAWLDSLKGTNGADGVDGDSAYEVWLHAGNDYNGGTTQDDYLKSLKGEKGDPGADSTVPGPEGPPGAGLVIQGEKPTEGHLPATGAEGEAWLVGGDLYVWDDDNSTWVNVGNIQGPPGATGKSAYEIATLHGFVGDEVAWLESLEGDEGAHGASAYEVWLAQPGNSGGEDVYLESLKGEPGDAGADGADSTVPGPQGDSAFEVWEQQPGNSGKDEQAFFEDIKGEKGEDGDNGLSAYDWWNQVYGPGTTDEYMDAITGPQGAKGKSAYDVAVDEGYVGTEQQWLNDLKGEQGHKGDSAYEVWAVDNPGGSKQDYYADIKGDTGDSAYDVWLGQGNTGDEAAYLEDIKGEKGDPGQNGTNGADGADGGEGPQGFPGVQGDPGDTGPSPYEYWLEQNHPGSSYPDFYDDYEDTIRGPQGKEGHSAYQSYLDTTPQPHLSEADWVASLKGEQGEQGIGINIIGEIMSGDPNDLPHDGTQLLGDAYIVGGQLYIWLEDEFGVASWHNAGKIQGPEGAEGPQGLSAYEIWLEEGNNGTKQDFLDSLVGPPGPDGDPGADGKDVDPATLAALQQEVTDNHNKILELEKRIKAREDLDTWGSLNTNPTP